MVKTRYILCLFLFTAFLSTYEFAKAQTIGMIADTSQSVIVFNADTDTVITTIPIPDVSDIGDCSITPDGSLGFVTNCNNQIFVIDLKANPPVLAGGTNPIAISNFGEDSTITQDGNFLLVCDFLDTQPVSSVNIATRIEVDTLALGICNAIEVCGDGSALAADLTSGVTTRLTVDRFGNLTNTGTTLASNSPIDVNCATSSGVILDFAGSSIISFALPGLGAIDTRATTGFAVNGVIDTAGSRFFIKTSTNVEGFSYNPVTGTLGGAAFFSVPSPFTGAFPGLDQLALHPNGLKLYVSEPGQVNILNPANGASIGSITNASIVGPTGICLAPPSVTNIPTLSQLGLIALAGVLGLVGYLVMRRRKVTA